MAVRRIIFKRKPLYEVTATFDIEWEEEHGFGTLTIDRDGNIADRD